MGSRLGLLAAAVIATVLALAPPVRAQPQAQAAALVKRGVDEYKAGKYSAAANLFEQAHGLDPRPETLFAWAQAERLAGDCEAAVILYRKLLAETADLNQARLIRENLALCVKVEPAPVEPVEQPTEPVRCPDPPPPPRPTIVRAGPGGFTIALVAGGTLGLGAGVGFFAASSSSRDGAERAGTLQEHDDLLARADRQRLVSYVVGAAGAGMLGYGLYRWITGRAPATEVAVAPARGATVVWVSTRW